MKYSQRLIFQFAAIILPFFLIVALFWLGVFHHGGFLALGVTAIAAHGMSAGLLLLIFARQSRTLKDARWRRCEGCGEVFTGDGEVQCTRCGLKFQGREVWRRWRKRLMFGYRRSIASVLVSACVGMIIGLGFADLLVGLSEPSLAFHKIQNAVRLAIYTVFVISFVWMLRLAHNQRQRVRAAQFCVCEQCGYPYEGEGEITCTECGDVFNGAEVRMRWLERVT